MSTSGDMMNMTEEEQDLHMIHLTMNQYLVKTDLNKFKEQGNE